MSSFQTGMQMGLTAMNMANQQRLQQAELEMAQAREARAAEEFGWKRDTQAEQKAAREGYMRTTSGFNQDQAGGIQNTYGMNQAQINKELGTGGMGGLQAKLASYDVPDSADLQNVPPAPAGGMQPRFTADQLKAGPVNRADREQALARMALSGLDTTALRQSHVAQDELARSDIAARIMKMPKKDLESQAADLNLSGYPLLYTGSGKNGYTFLKTEADGKTPIAGSQFTLNESQLRQMALAHELGNAGFGNEAMATLAAAHKDIGDHMAKWNETMTKLATTNNTATHYGNQDANQAAHISVLRNHYNKPNYTQFEGTDGQPVYLDLSKVPQSSTGQLQLPQGVRPMRQAAQLNDMEKIAYGKAMDEIAMLPQNAAPNASAVILRKYGLDPSRFGGQGAGGLPSTWGPQGGAAPAAGPGPGPAPAPQGGLTYNQRLQGAYDRWMAAKAPWYLPTPTANSAERAAEEEYTALLRAGR